MYFNDQENRASIDSELLVNNAVLLRKPVDAVVTLPHPTGKNLHFQRFTLQKTPCNRRTCGWRRRWRRWWSLRSCGRWTRQRRRDWSGDGGDVIKMWRRRQETSVRKRECNNIPGLKHGPWQTRSCWRRCTSCKSHVMWNLFQFIYLWEGSKHCK